MEFKEKGFNASRDLFAKDSVRGRVDKSLRDWNYGGGITRREMANKFIHPLINHVVNLVEEEVKRALNATTALRSHEKEVLTMGSRKPSDLVFEVLKLVSEKFSLPGHLWAELEHRFTTAIEIRDFAHENSQRKQLEFLKEKHSRELIEAAVPRNRKSNGN